MKRLHQYTLAVKWTGNKGSGTNHYSAYERSHAVSAVDKPELLMSSDPQFRGDKSKYNPEELLVASLASCHMLWYLHLCAEAGVVVTAYTDRPQGIMEETPDGGGYFTELALYPVVTVSAPSMSQLAHHLHKEANKRCFIANSVRFPVKHYPEVKVISTQT